MRLFLVTLLLMSLGSSYAQQSYFEDIMFPVVTQFAKNSTQIYSFEQLPEFIRNQFSQLHKEELEERKFTYMAASGNDYLFVYDHGDSTDHYHTIVCQTDGKIIKSFNEFVSLLKRDEPEKLATGKIQTLVEGFVSNSQRFTSFRMLPEFVVNYIEHYNGRAFELSRYKKLSFVAVQNNNYILSYDHRIEAHHFHSIIFETNGKEVTTVYNVITFEVTKNVRELMNIVGVRWYWLRNEHL